MFDTVEKHYHTDVKNVVNTPKFPDTIKIGSLPELQIRVKQQETVTISLEEYESLKKENESLRTRNKHYSDFMHNIIKPLKDENVPDDIIEKILDNKFKAKVSLMNQPFDFSTRVGVVYIVDKDMTR